MFILKTEPDKWEQDSGSKYVALAFKGRRFYPGARPAKPVNVELRDQMSRLTSARNCVAPIPAVSALPRARLRAAEQAQPPKAWQCARRRRGRRGGRRPRGHDRATRRPMAPAQPNPPRVSLLLRVLRAGMLRVWPLAPLLPGPWPPTPEPRRTASHCRPGVPTVTAVGAGLVRWVAHRAHLVQCQEFKAGWGAGVGAVCAGGRWCRCCWQVW